MEKKEEITQQETINKRLEAISKEMKNVVSGSANYIEYVATLIYVMYENREKLQSILLYHTINDIRYLLEKFDIELQAIRKKEQMKKLFSNITFSKQVKKENYIVFENLMKELNDLIFSLGENGKAKLAKAFEYIIMKAAARNEISSTNGEFYTPKGLVKTMVRLLDIRENMAIYNPASGTGEFLIESAKAGKIYAFGEETNIANYNVCNTNLWLHDIENKRIKEEEEEKIPKVDIAIGNPPFVETIKEDINTDLYYHYGIEPSSKNSYLKFLVKMLENVHDYGKIAIIVPHGFLFKKTKSEYNVRRKLIEKKWIEAIIALPEKLFYDTKIPVVIVLMNKAKKREEILFIDSSKEYKSKRKTNILTVENQEKIVNTYRKYEEIENYSYLASFKEMIQNDYDLNIKKYVKLKNNLEEINEKEIKRKIESLEEERYKICNEIKDLLEKN